MRMVIAGGVIALLIILYGCASVPPQTGDGMNQSLCESGRGHWNGTACQCGGIAGFGCPQGYACGDYYQSSTTPDAMGICKKR